MKLHKAILPGKKKLLLFAVAIMLSGALHAQPIKPFYVKETRAENRTKLYKSLVAGINRDLSLPLADSTEENWMDAFYSVELLRYRSPWVEGRMHAAFKNIEQRSIYFQRSLIEVIYDAYPLDFLKEVEFLLYTTPDLKCFAGCAEYLMKLPGKCSDIVGMKIGQRLLQYPDTALMKMLQSHVLATASALPPLNDLLQHHFFDNAKVVFSFQRKNRNYPGIVVVRDSAGNFVKNENGQLFTVPQLARSISNMPGYISNGNTPQGIFRMYGTSVSRSIFIGPTPNIQLSMPFECSIQQFMNDSSNTDSVWTEDTYRKLLPQSWSNYFPLLEAYYAGKAGRTEIIAHGTTVDPAYYKGQSYYPFTPTLGCLCTRELWSETDGSRKESDQQKLVDVLNKAGGADGYYIVLELNDEQRAVTLNDVLPFIK